ncbi:MAG: GntR family transcriptional regulator [Thermoleophilia bacterium]|nr:GntR family transcriptional regulator [Thermoleophilia bacterium]
MTATTHHGLVDRLAAAIQSRVLSGEIATGTRLRQESLASEFGVSRTPVREALRQLQSTGIVSVEPNRGAVVRGPSARDIREAYAVRAELEGFAAEHAVAHIEDAQLDQLRAAERLFRHSIQEVIEYRQRGLEPDWSTESEWERANNLFHAVIQEAAGNRELLATIAQLHRRFPRDLTWSALSRSSHLLAENVEQHAGILSAIEARDPARARRAMTEHVRAAGELIARRLENHG